MFVEHVDQEISRERHVECLSVNQQQEDLRLAGEDRSPKKWVEAGMNYGSWRLIERSGKNS